MNRFISSSLAIGSLLITSPVMAETQQLSRLIELLHHNGNLSTQDYQQLMAAVSPAEPTKAPDTVTLNANGLTVESHDQAFAVKIGGRLHTDYGVIKQASSSRETDARIRNARLGMQGHVHNDWQYKLEFDFAGNQTNATDLFIGYSGFDAINITLGRHKMPSGLEALTGIGNIGLMERSLPSNLFSAGRQNGLSLTGGGQSWSWATAGWLGESRANYQDSRYGVGSRLSYAPYSRDQQHLHLGMSSYYQNYRKTHSDQGRQYRDLTLSSRPEISIASTDLFQSRLESVRSSQTYGLEAAYIRGPWSMQSEWFQQQINSAGQHRQQQGWTIAGNYMLTGESRNYQASTGRIGGIRPAQALNEGGYGAFELVVRYSDAHLQGQHNGIRSDNKAELWTVGLNWYATQSVRFMANYNHVDLSQTAQAKQQAKALQIRGQLVF